LKDLTMQQFIKALKDIARVKKLTLRTVEIIFDIYIHIYV